MELKFTPFDWDKSTTPRMLYNKAVDLLNRTRAEFHRVDACGTAPNGNCPERLADLIDSMSFGPRFEFDAHNFPPDGPLPRHRYLAIYAIEGDNEGHYIHVDFIIVSDVITSHDRKIGINRWEAIPLMYMKTFAGLEFSLEVVATLTRFFNHNA